MLAGGYIALRKMKNNHTMVVSAYVNVCLMIVSVTCILFSRGVSFGFVTDLSISSWILFIIAAVLTIGD
jgi:predicted transporter